MLLSSLVPLLGVLAGRLLFRRASVLTTHADAPALAVSVIVPARNEEANLPVLLSSLRSGTLQPLEVIVVDDHSTDRTAEVSRSFGAKVIAAEPLPHGWTGKTWACAQGAHAATGAVLLFFDADTSLEQHGLQRMLVEYAASPQPAALSLLPYHRMQRPYEQLSLFFNLIMAAAAGGFSGLVPPELFGQSLLIGRKLYDAAGGHESVRGHVLENLHFAANVRKAGGHTVAMIGRGTLSMRMFPQGTGQLIEGWSKGFATGAARTPASSVALICLWITCAILAASHLVVAASSSKLTLMHLGIALAIYGAVALQIFLAARRLGSFKVWAAALYPIFLAFYLAVFARSMILRWRGSGATWKGRSL